MTVSADGCIARARRVLGSGSAEEEALNEVVAIDPHQREARQRLNDKKLRREL